MRQIDSDLLAAASMLVASIGLLYSTWHAQIEKAINVEPKLQTLDRDAALKEVRQAMGRAGPLAGSALAFVIVFGPTAGSIVCGFLHRLSNPSWRDYDPVLAAFCVVYLIAVVLAGSSVAQVGGLWSARKMLKT
ncbi:hypothetical protein [Longispora urticae]